MINRICLIVCFVFFTTSIFAQQTNNEVEVTKEVYKEIDEVELSINIYVPEKRANNNGAIVLIHGGGWNSGSPAAMNKYAKHFSERGLVVFTPQYRIRNKNNTTIYEAVQDVKSVMDWVVGNSDKYNFDLDYLSVGGGSAGGHLATTTVFMPELGASEKGIEYKVKCFVLFNPVLDVSKDGYGHNKVKTELEAYNLTWQQFSPIDNIKENLAPTIVVVGDRDKVLPVKTAERFKMIMEEKGNECKLKIYPGAEHSFFNYGYGTKQGYPKGTSNKYYYEVLQELDNFLVSQNMLDEKIKIEIPKEAIYPIRK